MTELVDVQLKGTKELHEVGLALKGLMLGVRGALDDGKVDLAEVVTIVTGSVGDLTKAVQGLDLADDELRDAPGAAVMGVLAPVAEGLETLLKKADSPSEDA